MQVCLLPPLISIGDSLGTIEVEILRAAVESGINFIDNAEVYGAYPGESEYIMGQARRGWLVFRPAWLSFGSL